MTAKIAKATHRVACRFTSRAEARRKATRCGGFLAGGSREVPNSQTPRHGAIWRNHATSVAWPDGRNSPSPARRRERPRARCRPRAGWQFGRGLHGPRLRWPPACFPKFVRGATHTQPNVHRSLSLPAMVRVPSCKGMVASLPGRQRRGTTRVSLRRLGRSRPQPTRPESAARTSATWPGR
jgi:hypothetical protein